MHVGQVGFLEVGFEPGPAVGDDREQRRLRLDLLAELEPEIDDHAGAGRLDLGVGQIQRRAIAQRLLFADRGVLVGRPVRLAAERRLDAGDALVQHREAVLPLLFLAVGLLDPGGRSDAASGQIAMTFGLGLKIRQFVLGLGGLGPDLAQAHLELLDGGTRGIGLGFGLGERQLVGARDRDGTARRLPRRPHGPECARR